MCSEMQKAQLQELRSQLESKGAVLRKRLKTALQGLRFTVIAKTIENFNKNPNENEQHRANWPVGGKFVAALERHQWIQHS